MVICLLVFGLVILGLFAFYEARFATNPLIPGRILSSRTNCASIIVLCLHSFVFISYDYFLPLYFQAVLGFNAIVSGVCLLALVVPLSAFTMSTGWYVKRKGDYQLPIWVGTCVMTLGTGLFISFGSGIDWPKIILFQIVVGMGAGPLFQSPMIALQSHVKQVDIAAAMSASSFMRSLCSSMSIVIGSVLIQKSLHGGKLTIDSDVGDDKDADQTLSAENSTSALSMMWIFYCAICGVMTLVSIFIEKMPAQNLTVDHASEGKSEKV
jgi:cyanate permease